MTTETRYNLTGDGVAMGALVRGEDKRWRWTPVGAPPPLWLESRLTADGLFGSLVRRLDDDPPRYFVVTGGDGRAVGTIERVRGTRLLWAWHWFVTVERPNAVLVKQHTSPGDAFEWMVRAARHKGR